MARGMCRISGDLYRCVLIRDGDAKGGGAHETAPFLVEVVHGGSPEPIEWPTLVPESRFDLHAAALFIRPA
jgi:hypothetical protein